MIVSKSARAQAIKWLDQHSAGLGRMYDREVQRAHNNRRTHLRIKPFKSPEWRKAVSSLAARYSFAARILREMPDEVPDMIRGFPPYGRAIRENMDRRAAYVAKMWDTLGVTKDADAALRAAYEGLTVFLVLE